MTDENDQNISEKYIKKSYEFLLDKFRTRKQFLKEEFRIYSGWGKGTFNTYFSKIFTHLLVSNEIHRFQVSNVFQKVSNYEKFRAYFSQSREIRAEYRHLSYKNVIIYEFFMPLTNETELRATLDSLFFKDTIINRLKIIPFDKLKLFFPLNENETKENYYERLCDWISEKFNGYSIGHFQGRFRADNLKTFDDVALIQKNAGRYIIDETTAIVKFIFSCGKPDFDKRSKDLMQFIQEFDSEQEDRNVQDDVKRIKFFFNILFVESILQVVNGEDEFWMLESGIRTRLHIWRVE